MLIDIRTFYTIEAGVSLSLGIVMALSALRHRNMPGLFLWSAGTLALSVGLIGFVLRGLSPDWFSIVIANELIFLHPIMVWNGARAFNARSTHWREPLAALALLLGFTIYFTYVRNDIGVRNVVISMALALSYLACAVELFLGISPSLRRPAWTAATALCILFCTLTFRAFGSRPSNPDLMVYLLSPLETVRAIVTTSVAVVVLVCLLLLAMQRLQQRIEERTAELERLADERDQARDRAEQANRAKSTFLAMMSHELRTPLNAILGFSELIRDVRMGPVEPVYRGYAGNIHDAGHHLLALINQVLDLSKIEVGRLQINEEGVDLLREVINASRQLISARAEDRGITLEEEIPDDLPELLGDRLRLKQIVVNLLSNAVKFTLPGGSILISVSLPATGGLELAIADTGIGMRPEDIPIALSPFRQLEGALNREHEGTGLGLPLTKSLTELHGGRLEVKSELRRGTVVTVSLPESRLLRLAAS